MQSEPASGSLRCIRPAVVSFQFGLPDETAVAAIRDSGIRVIATATTVAEAARLEELGADAVIAQGAEGVTRQDRVLGDIDMNDCARQDRAGLVVVSRSGGRGHTLRTASRA